MTHCGSNVSTMRLQMKDWDGALVAGPYMFTIVPLCSTCSTFQGYFTLGQGQNSSSGPEHGNDRTALGGGGHG